MDTVSVPHDIWALQEEIRGLKVAQFEHAERLSRLENRQDDSKLRSLWPSWSTPFPAPLSTFSHAPPNNHEQPNAFHPFEENVLAGLELDEVDVPRRGASRANSVRFDDSAITNHWIRDSSPSASDYFRPRSSNMEDYAMTERSMSHKSDQRSDGRYSSMRSYVETGSSFDGENGMLSRTPEMLHCNARGPSLPVSEPGPALVRCLLDPRSPYDPHMYALVCTGSTRSHIGQSLVTRLGLDSRTREDGNKEYRVLELSIFLPDAIQNLHLRGTSQTKMPRLTIDFIVIPNESYPQENDIAVLCVGSDVISAHMGDVLFSQRKLLLYADDGLSVCIPFVRADPIALSPGTYTMQLESRLPSIFSPRISAESAKGVGQNTDIRFSRSSSSGAEDGISPHPLMGSISQQQVPFNGSELPFAPLKTTDNPITIDYKGDDATREEHEEVEQRGRSKGTIEKEPDNSRRHTTNGHSLPRPHRGTDLSTGSGKVLRSRSYTNIPTDSRALTIGDKGTSSNFWDTRRKTSLTSAEYQQPATGSGSKSRASSRGMKVLRTSKSSSLSEAKANNNFGAKSTSPSDSKLASPVAGTGANKAIHRRANSGEGGAFQAFHWMTPKPVSG